jgi:phage terminase small subunit
MPILKNAKHEKFAQLLAKLHSQDAAYAGAGYKPNASHASRLARNGKVKARLADLVAAGAEKAEIDVAKVLAELGKIAFANMQDYIGITSDGDPYVTLSAMTREQAAAVQQITVEDYKDGRGEDARDVRKITFKLADKRAALVDIGTHLKMFTQKVELTGKDGAELVPIINLNASRRHAG